MKILFQSRKTLFTVPGGDTTQLLKTADALRRLGHVVDVSLALEPDLTNYDIVHLFNLIRPQEIYLQARNAKKQGKKVALSTIYVDYSEVDRYARRNSALFKYFFGALPNSSREYLKILARALANREINKGTFSVLLRGYRRLQEKILAYSDVLLPNSLSEQRRVTKDFGVSAAPTVVVPNGVDAALFFQNEEIFPTHQSAQNNEGCILCVARVEPGKNQLNLAMAMQGLPWKLILIGEAAPNHHRYLDAIREKHFSNVEIIGNMEHARLLPYYRAARVHVLASWMETTGLVSLEAGAAGCNLVITKKGDTEDYFQNFVSYCQPDDISSIRLAISQAYHAPYPNRALQTHIRNNFTWDIAAQKTLEGYQKALG